MQIVKKRLDTLLFELGYFPSRALAQAAIMEGRVLVNGKKIEKAGHPVPVNSEIRIIGENLPYVSRGGLKLEAALKHFKFDINGMRCLDVGASTGGFTDCLLQHGAAEVVALDVGKGQIHERLRKDPRVKILDGINAREITDDFFDKPFDLITIDVSFISQKLILPALIPHLKEGGFIISLIKPQFEAGRDKIEKGGIVKDEKVRNEVVKDIKLLYISKGFEFLGVIESPIKGQDGNVEYLMAVRK